MAQPSFSKPRKEAEGEGVLQITEDKSIPPYETAWHALPPTTTMYLSKAYKQKLLDAAIKRARGKPQLRQARAQKGSGRKL